MKIQYLFSKNNKIGSYLIRFGCYWINNYDFTFDNTPSHVAILIDETYVIESIMACGVRIIPYNKWLEHNVEIMKINSDICVEHPKDLMFEMWGKPYDTLGILRFAIDIFRYKVFDIELPLKNKWEREDYFFCTEFASRIYDGDTGSTRTPNQLMRLVYGRI